MRDTDSNKFMTALAIIATPFALGAFMLAWSSAGQFAAEDPKLRTLGDYNMSEEEMQELQNRVVDSIQDYFDSYDWDAKFIQYFGS
jgi:hypothetical protein